MTGSRERVRQCSDPACGNSDVVFMDVYLSASPPGSSHFPLGDGCLPGQTFPLHLKVVWPSDRCTYMHEKICCWNLNFDGLMFTSDVTWTQTWDSFAACLLYIITDPKLNTSKCQEMPLEKPIPEHDDEPRGCCKVGLQHIMCLHLVSKVEKNEKSFNQPTSCWILY